MKKHLVSLHDLREHRAPVHDVNKRHREKLGPLDRLALAISRRIGTMGFFFIIMGWTILWLGWNFLAPENLKFDPPMGFVFWLFISNMIQIFLMPMIMIAQNIESRHAELRAELSYQATIKSEKEIEVLLGHLEYQNALLEAIAKKLDIDLQDFVIEGKK